MEAFGNPSKKPRLEDELSDWDAATAVNDDLWGQDDLTAEEFDMLEIQATQPIIKECNNHEEITLPGPEETNIFVTRTTTCSNGKKDEVSKQREQQFVLEGQIKILRDTLDKTEKELTEERINREEVIGKRVEHFKGKEIKLQEKIERLETEIHFKGQEMRVAHDKIHTLEQKVKEQFGAYCLSNTVCYEQQQASISERKISPRKFLNRFNFEARKQVPVNEMATQTEQIITHHRKYKLSLRNPRGKLKGSDIVSKLLCSRNQDIIACNYVPCLNEDYHFPDIVSNDTQWSRIKLPFVWSVARLNSGQQSEEELMSSYEVCIQEHINFLQQVHPVGNRSHQIFSRGGPSKMRDRVLYSSPSPPSSMTSEADYHHTKIISCLMNLTKLLSSWTPKSVTDWSRVSIKDDNEKTGEKKYGFDIQAIDSNPLFPGDEEMTEAAHQRVHPLVKLLFALASPCIYPEGYSKNSEIQWSLAALLAWSSTSVKSLEACICNLPLYSLVSGKCSIESACLTLELLMNFIPLDNFKSAFRHQSGTCLFCGIAELCHHIHQENLNSKTSSFVIKMIEDFLCGVNARFHFDVINTDLCSSQLLQAVIIVLWRQLQWSRQCFLPCQTITLKKGIILLSQMSIHVANFRSKRLAVEDEYVALICGLSKLCKQNSEFRELLDTVHDLWDFQDDTSEFDSDEIHAPVSSAEASAAPNTILTNVPEC